MGGGAGIKFTSDIEAFSIEIEYTPSKSKTDLEYTISVDTPDTFDMVGYDDGRTGIPCEGLFKGVVENGIAFYDEKIIEMINYYIKEFNLEESDVKNVIVFLEGEYEMEDMFFAGYCRGNLDGTEKIDCNISGIDDPIIYITDNNEKLYTYNKWIEEEFMFDYEDNINIKLQAKNPERFVDIYNDIFNNDEQ